VVTDSATWTTIDDLDALTEVIGEPLPRTRDKARPALNAATWDPEGLVPRRAVIAQLCERPDDSLQELDAYYDEANYSRGLYA